jgi:hypothetical protein
MREGIEAPRASRRSECQSRPAGYWAVAGKPSTYLNLRFQVSVNAAHRCAYARKIACISASCRSPRAVSSCVGAVKLQTLFAEKFYGESIFRRLFRAEYFIAVLF